MKDSKVIASLRDAILRSGLKDGMRISFHHLLRTGDGVMNMVLAALASMGFRGLTLNSSSVFDVQSPLIEHIKNGVIGRIETDYMGAAVGRFISRGGMKEPVIFRSHGGRPGAIEQGITPIDVAFIAAPSADPMGNATGSFGKSACGSLGYAEADARCAAHSIVITDNLVPYPLERAIIQEPFFISDRRRRRVFGRRKIFEKSHAGRKNSGQFCPGRHYRRSGGHAGRRMLSVHHGRAVLRSRRRGLAAGQSPSRGDFGDPLRLSRGQVVLRGQSRCRHTRRHGNRHGF